MAVVIAGTPPDFTAWYNPTSSVSASDLAADAYAKAVRFFEQELSNDEQAKAWIHGHVSMDDVRHVVQQAKQKYDDRSARTRKTRESVEGFASTVVRYGGVLDSLAQADPLHAGLAWGAIKFVFTGVLQHAELVTELTNALKIVGEELPRAQIDATLYNTPFMQDAIAKLYAYILLFLQKAVKWYTMSSARRAMSSILSPYCSSFKDIVEGIKHCAYSVDAIAGTSGRVEVRGLTRAAEVQAEKMDEMQAWVRDLQLQLQRTEATVLRVLQLSQKHHDLTQSIKLDTTDTRSRICDMQLSIILKALTIEPLPEDVLCLRRSFAKRSLAWRQPGRDSDILTQRLKEWMFVAGSSTLVVNAGPRAAERTKNMVVDVINVLKSTAYPVFTYLEDPKRRKAGGPSAVLAILKSITFQAIRFDPSIVSRDHRLGDIRAFEMEHTLTEWTGIACLALSKLKECILVVEAETVPKATRTKSSLTHRLPVVHILEQIVECVTKTGSVLKVLMVTYGSQANFCSTSGANHRFVAMVGPPLPASRRSKYPVATPLRIGSGRNDSQPRLIAI